MRFRIAGLKARRHFKLHLGFVNKPGLQQYESEIIVALGEFGIMPHQLAEDIRSTRGINVLT